MQTFKSVRVAKTYRGGWVVVSGFDVTTSALGYPARFVVSNGTDTWGMFPSFVEAEVILKELRGY